MNVKPPVTPSTGDESRAGFFFALSAFLIWGVLALFWKATSHIDAVEVTAHRVVWSLPVAVAILWAMGRTGDVLPAMRSPRKLGILFICATIISLNWGVFIWAISVDRTIDTALAYYINPLVSVAMGAIFLGERFNRLQLIAIAIAFCAVLLLSVLSGEVPWISLWLAGTFALYGLLRKTVDVGPAQGFLVEVILMFPFGAIYVLVLLADGASSFLAGSGTDNLLLILAGPATSIPLILYASGAKRLRLATIGMMQYIAPTMIFLIGLFIFKEPISQWQWLAFAMIWIALAFYSWSLTGKRMQSETAPGQAGGSSAAE
ncbi:MAG: EamA family transporter RarD [Rhizobiaceae bacterium]|jgi:chloramphenicol-sensitive protein RarD|nr:EamA family transporter RarD [Rhizobiaceae bacterium]